MSQLNRGQVRALVASMIDYPNDSGSDYRTNLDNWLNIAGRYVWRARPWPERQVETRISTVAPYTTGTASVTKGSTSLTGSGTTWTSGMTGRKFTPSYGSPWYRFTYVGATSGTLEDAFAETTLSGSAYSIFQDEYDLYDLSATMETIVRVEALSSLSNGWLRRMSAAELDGLAYVHGATGRPTTYAPTLFRTSGVRRIRLYPIPDDVYRLRVLGLGAFTDMTSDSDTPALSQNKERALILATCLEAQRSGDAKEVVAYQEVEEAIDKAWREDQSQQPMSVRRRSRSGYRGSVLWAIDPDVSP
jgi:hypothetical protein